MRASAYWQPAGWTLAGVLLAAVLPGCGSQSAGPVRQRGAREAVRPASPAAAVSTQASVPPPPPLVVTPTSTPRSAWRVVAQVRGQAAAWEAQRGGVTLLRFDRRSLRLDLHAGEGEPSGSWRYGPLVAPSEIHHLVAAFNGGFKFSTGEVGWMSAGRVAEPLQRGRGSIVTYRDGTTAIGAWQEGVPAAGRAVYSVLQNLSLLVDGGRPAANAEGCIQSCWGSTVGNVDVVARSALGIRQDGQLVWAAGEQLTPLALAQALAGAGVSRAVQLDINPDWVAGYLYTHGHSGPSWSQVVPGQLGIAGKFLAPYHRDFFAVVAR